MDTRPPLRLSAWVVENALSYLAKPASGVAVQLMAPQDAADRAEQGSTGLRSQAADQVGHADQPKGGEADLLVTRGGRLGYGRRVYRKTVQVPESRQLVAARILVVGDIRGMGG